MNHWYEKINGSGMNIPAQPGRSMMPQSQRMANPMQMAATISQAMKNPAMFARQAFSDVPSEMWNDPSRALQYIQQTRGLSDADLQNLIGSFSMSR